MRRVPVTSDRSSRCNTSRARTRVISGHDRISVGRPGTRYAMLDSSSTTSSSARRNMVTHQASEVPTVSMIAAKSSV